MLLGSLLSLDPSELQRVVDVTGNISPVYQGVLRRWFHTSVRGLDWRFFLLLSLQRTLVNGSHQVSANFVTGLARYFRQSRQYTLAAA